MPSYFGIKETRSSIRRMRFDASTARFISGTNAITRPEAVRLNTIAANALRVEWKNEKETKEDSELSMEKKLGGHFRPILSIKIIDIYQYKFTKIGTNANSSSF
ncbi:unnamed protein product [Echinostoma caproni]|uniref:Uncharacterized protein n=1 Tax=Echinostoma caproni TaxID=27848 RepID=A0A183BAY7_9TREM|nr:unnamed protein product [Echinostoma caproni]